MKPLNASLLLFLLAPLLLCAQTEERPFALGLWGGSTQYNGDLGVGFYHSSGVGAQLHAGISAAWYIAPHFDFSMNFTAGKQGYEADSLNRFEANQYQWNSHVRVSLFPAGKFPVNPYAFAGIGVSYMDKVRFPGTDVFIPFGAGVKWLVSDRLQVHMQETFAYTDHDNRDNQAKENNDAFLMHSIGVTWNIGKVKDTDGDGVSDKKDKCPDTPAGTAVDASGCPLDRDGDGIADISDACPDVKGAKSARGCPDKDGDTVTDSLDRCPDVAGTVSADPALNGCPDRDGDGITDAGDRCPELKGTREAMGCPDSDGDGIIDPDDKCPDVKGVEVTGGCPEDTTTKGGPRLAPLPVIQPVYFATGSAVLTPEALLILDKAAALLKANRNYVLEINGHTDNTGTETNNKPLSVSRAARVQDYLLKKGVSRGQLRTAGLSDTQPAASNNDESTRRFNRRVEFNLLTP